MRIYVASPSQNKAEARYWQHRLREVGHTITHDWTIEDEKEGGDAALTLNEQQKYAVADARGVLTADVVWVIAPPTGGTGVWFEMGLAAGLQVAFLTSPDHAPFPPLILVSGVERRTIFTSFCDYEESHEAGFAHIARTAAARRSYPLDPSEPPGGYALANGRVPQTLATALARGVRVPTIARVFLDPNPGDAE